MNEIASSRRTFLKKSSLLAIAGIAGPSVSSGFFTSHSMPESEVVDGEFTLPPLPYAYDALEPHLDKLTMEIHYTKHHQGYVNNLNKLVQENNIHATLDELVKNASKYPEGVRNNGGGHWNHSMFWKVMRPGGSSPSGKISSAIAGAFESLDNFQEKFASAASKRFGSGWAWLVRTPSGKLEIGSTPNQDNPLMDLSAFRGIPLLGLDVWEHAYYLKFYNKRGDYIREWWNVINWDQVAENLALAESNK
ncbi:MAG: superoxide dismutase [Bacteroidia bacterium]|nr:superoxide dismutase [Bacteroidia bacterium]